jgi:hypothetical protein
VCVCVCVWGGGGCTPKLWSSCSTTTVSRLNKWYPHPVPAFLFPSCVLSWLVCFGACFACCLLLLLLLLQTTTLRALPPPTAPCLSRASTPSLRASCLNPVFKLKMSRTGLPLHPRYWCAVITRSWILIEKNYCAVARRRGCGVWCTVLCRGPQHTTTQESTHTSTCCPSQPASWPAWPASSLAGFGTGPCVSSP